MGNDLRDLAICILSFMSTNLDIQARKPLLHDVSVCVEETLVGCDDDVPGAEVARATFVQGSSKCS
jgi:hypothetical protein